MIYLAKSANAWGLQNFEQTLTEEVSELGLNHLPLQQGLSSSSVALYHNLKLLILDITPDKHQLVIIKMGAFYSGIISGCSCSDDPSPTDEVNEYCELLLSINLDNAETTIQLLEE